MQEVYVLVRYLLLLGAAELLEHPAFGLHRQDDVLAHGEVGYDTLGLAVVREEAHAHVHGVYGLVDLRVLAVHLERAGLRLVRAVDGARELAAAGAQQARQAHDLALVYLEVEGFYRPLVAETLGLDLERGVLLHFKALGLYGGKVVKILAHRGSSATGYSPTRVPLRSNVILSQTA